MSYAPQDLYQWLSALSVIVAGAAVKYAAGLSNRFVVLETLFAEKTKKVDKLSDQQIADGVTLALHTQSIATLQATTSSINAKLETLVSSSARLETLMTAVAPALAAVIPREVVERRFEGIESQLNNRNKSHSS